MSEISEAPTTNVAGLPRLNEPAPAFTAQTTQGQLSLTDYRGKWVVLFSHPADFTPVCSTEFMAFAHHADDFSQRDTQLIGLSIDSVHAHLAWLRDLEEMSGVEVPFPVIADLDMKVAHAFGMIHPGASQTAAVRAVFLIDPEGILRGMLYYPLSVGRSIPEILRFLDALRFSDEQGMSTPADWNPGDPAIVGAPKTMDEIRADDPSKYHEFRRWYLRLNEAA
ncbi:MAG: peroxiredoxin [Trueperaceae bacterium]|nr:peroxiredoxin [Trueperaceae bacterium]